MNKNYYKILEISSNAEIEEVKENFRRLAKKYHPDISKEKNAENKFREIIEAYEILSNPKTKQEYDESFFVPSFDKVKYDYFFDFNNKTWLKKRFKKPKKGPLLVGKVVLKAADVINVGKANVTLLVEENCKSCQGTGYYVENGFECFCTTCGGFGRYEESKTIVVYLPSLSKPKQKVTIHRVGHAGYAGGERGDMRLKLILS
ncbi:DnaJ domain-containing protein [Spiroplasma sp. SV19]|uniref:DnaJ domain-containing protein n=1 Tax=Spiroplasma sp. SV19 TaxID=2570468 RepID=UPI0024B63FBC|nr:DnaJ domain-containing protein [Spiroplasma sp. SV19]WHQ36463.1 DnaJ domain-containing protein [Spiroplasma sp. SV19]